MPARDAYHDAVRNALIKDGWTITHDPYRITVGQRTVYVDLGAERVIAAERGSDRIAVEIKTFVGASDLHDLYEALGQYLMYRVHLRYSDPERRLYLAVPQDVRLGLLQEPIAVPAMDTFGIALSPSTRSGR
jgi:hypothetical protein